MWLWQVVWTELMYLYMHTVFGIIFTKNACILQYAVSVRSAALKMPQWNIGQNSDNLHAHACLSGF